MTAKNVTARLRKTLPMLWKAKAWNQSRLAEAAGVAPQRVTDWKKGNHLPDADNLRALAQGSGVSLDWLLVTDRVPMMWADRAEVGDLARALVNHVRDSYDAKRHRQVPASIVDPNEPLRFLEAVARWVLRRVDLHTVLDAPDFARYPLVVRDHLRDVEKTLRGESPIIEDVIKGRVQGLIRFGAGR